MPPADASSEIRGTYLTRLAGFCTGMLMHILHRTLRFEVFYEDKKAFDLGNRTSPFLFALWHNRIVIAPSIWVELGGRPLVVLTSASKDGSLVANAMRFFRIGAVRGSSSRRAVSALIALKKALLTGSDVCITPDGPRGPVYRIQLGIIKLAQSTQTPIVPLHFFCENAWRLRTWDRFQIPKPFSRVRVIIGAPRLFSPDLSPIDFRTQALQLEDDLRAHCDDAIPNAFPS